MKLKICALFLALTVTSWAQTTTQTPPAAAPQENAAPQAKADCPCCEKMASMKEGQSCCHHEKDAKDGKAMSCGHGDDGATCCKGKDKDAMSCMKGEKGKAASCGDCCGKDHEKDCCASHKKDDKTAMNCCSAKQCGGHSAMHASGTSGN